MKLYYKDSLGAEYSGDKAFDVVKSLFGKTCEGIPNISFDEWQRDQLRLVKRFRDVSIVDLKTEENAQLYLNARVQGGDLMGITNLGKLSRQFMSERGQAALETFGFEYRTN